jgi:hypothetical protein
MATPTSKKPKKSGGGAKKESEAKKARTAKYAEKYAWKLIAPAIGEPTTKEVDKKTYHFCPHHSNGLGAWVIHLPSKCDQHDAKKKEKTPKDKIMSLTKVLQAIQDEAGEASSDKDK